jgi:hypothetical protein
VSRPPGFTSSSQIRERDSPPCRGDGNRLTQRGRAGARRVGGRARCRPGRPPLDGSLLPCNPRDRRCDTTLLRHKGGLQRPAPLRGPSYPRELRRRPHGLPCDPQEGCYAIRGDSAPTGRGPHRPREGASQAQGDGVVIRGDSAAPRECCLAICGDSMAIPGAVPQMARGERRKGRALAAEAWGVRRILGRLPYSLWVDPHETGGGLEAHGGTSARPRYPWQS